MIQYSLFFKERELLAIDRIKKFYRLCESLGYMPVLGFSGGKDSQVCYDLTLRAGIPFKAVFNHSFESNETIRFIKSNYPSVVFRRNVKEGFFQNMIKNHNRLLPTVEFSYCCEDYKHNKKNVDYATILGVRATESNSRKNRKLLETKNKKFLKKNQQRIYEYFSESCVASGDPSEISLKPIVDWSEDEVWEYIKVHHLSVNPEYASENRVGCMICPKANFSHNVRRLMKMPLLVDCVLKVRDDPRCDWIITSENADYSERKVEYVCRWLNHSFRPFSKRQKAEFEKFKKIYEEYKNGRSPMRSVAGKIGRR